jgi:plastocyanin
MKHRPAALAGSTVALCGVAAAAAIFGGQASAARTVTCAHPKATTVKVDMYEMGFQLKPSGPIPCGKVTFKEKNSGAISHNFHIEGYKGGKLLPAGGSATQVFTLKPGKHSYSCDVLGHAQAGMSGNLTVKR